VSFDDWMLALHVLSAFALVGGVILFWVVIIAGRQAETPEATLRIGPMARLAGAVVGIGAGGTLVLGIWLAFSVGGYDIWDGWIVAALVLWAVTAALGQRTEKEYSAAVNRALELQRAGRNEPDAELVALNRTSRGLLLQALATATVLLVLVDMIWKPGA
jgi:uncharacterized membrane protein